MQAHHAWSAHPTEYWAPTGIQDADAVPHRHRSHRSETGGASVVSAGTDDEAAHPIWGIAPRELGNVPKPALEHPR